MALAVVRSLGSPRRLTTAQDLEDFEQELVDQYLLAAVGAGIGDAAIRQDRRLIFEFGEFLNSPVWTAGPEDADRFLRYQRKELGLMRSTVYRKSLALAQFFDFLIARYQGDVHALTGCVLTQPIDEHNRPANPTYGEIRIPPSDQDVETLFGAWRPAVRNSRKFLPAARDYVAASLWRRVRLRISETAMLDIRDWRPDLGTHGKLHIRYGKGSHRRGPKPRLVPAINGVDGLITWWLTDVRHQFGEDWSDPDAPMFPSERHDGPERCGRARPNTLRSGFTDAVAAFLPTWAGRLTPHGMRHFCASSMYAQGMDLKAIQELLGHAWLSTTTRYIHVHAEHIEHAWQTANERTAARLIGTGG
ncbi:tyrosine-type recombinase/integrase [Lentzea atacamensis]|nr:tyrosine-type recombinase/integrase [Lentzea atacamensis]